jgi:RNase H-fold protein (predicted Holliday junction resolvase)
LLTGVAVGTDSSSIRAEFENLTKDKSKLSNKNEITCMEWLNESSKQIVVGHKNKLKLYDTSLAKFTNETDSTDASICGVFHDKRFVFK